MRNSGKPLDKLDELETLEYFRSQARIYNHLSRVDKKLALMYNNQAKTIENRITNYADQLVSVDKEGRVRVQTKGKETFEIYRGTGPIINVRSDKDMHAVDYAYRNGLLRDGDAGSVIATRTFKQKKT